LLRWISGRPLPHEAWEILTALLLLSWRVSSYPTAGLWRDWVALLCLFWIFIAAAGKTRAAPIVTAGFMAALLALYATGQLPFTLAVLGASR
jgi:hypothetical protein